jgi:prevent-host-death family protein
MEDPVQIVGVKEIKNNLSRYLRRIKAGEEIVITERGKPIARIIREDRGRQSIRDALFPLIEKGLVAMPSIRIAKSRLVPRELPGKQVSEMVVEDRR